MVGLASSFTLAANERIVRMEDKSNNVLVDQVTFITMTADGTQRSYGPFGKTSKTPFSVEGYIIGFYGRSGNFLDALGTYYLKSVKKSDYSEVAVVAPLQIRSRHTFHQFWECRK